jgi:hypothetical protein
MFVRNLLFAAAVTASALLVGQAAHAEVCYDNETSGYGQGGSGNAYCHNFDCWDSAYSYYTGGIRTRYGADCSDNSGYTCPFGNSYECEFWGGWVPQ